jgi:hypothetical protein
MSSCAFSILNVRPFCLLNTFLKNLHIELYYLFLNKFREIKRNFEHYLTSERSSNFTGF